MSLPTVERPKEGVGFRFEGLEAPGVDEQRHTRDNTLQSRLTIQEGHRNH